MFGKRQEVLPSRKLHIGLKFGLAYMDLDLKEKDVIRRKGKMFVVKVTHL